MIVLAVSGPIGAGKSSVCDMLVSLGAIHIDADKVAHDIMGPGTRLHREIIEHYAGDVRCADGGINRKKLAEIIFSDESSRLWLNERVHPEVIRRILARLREISTSGAKVAAIESALLGEVQCDPFWHHLLWVSAPPATRIARLVARGMSAEDAERRVRVQAERVPIPEGCPRHVIDNSHSLEETRLDVARIWRDLGLPC